MESIPAMDLVAGILNPMIDDRLVTRVFQMLEQEQSEHQVKRFLTETQGTQ